jgi:hypothetical protein
VFDADEILEGIYRKYDINWNFVIGRKANFLKLKHHIKLACIRLVEAQDNPIVITTAEVRQWLLRHVRGSFDFIEQKNFESVDEYDRSRTVIEIATFDYQNGVEQYVWYKGFKKNLNIYYLLELEGFNINVDINRILANDSFMSSMKNDAKSYIQYKAQYSEKLAEKIGDTDKYAFRGIGGCLSVKQITLLQGRLQNVTGQDFGMTKRAESTHTESCLYLCWKCGIFRRRLSTLMNMLQLSLMMLVM